MAIKYYGVIFIRKIDKYVGTKINHLQILERIPVVLKNGKKTSHFRCLCDCGNETIADAYNIIKGSTKTCGCGEIASRYDRKHSKLNPGDRFGKLTLVKDTGKRGANKAIIWECKCDCGNTVEIQSSYLINGWWTSCGCSDHIIRHHRRDLSGERFGHLTVINKNIEESKIRKRSVWNCKCDCGNTTVVDGRNLLNNHTTSCGCNKFKSRGEQLVEDILNELHIDFIPQYKFQDCKNKLPLPFDYYIPDKRVAIEYDGQAHFKPIEFWGGQDGFLTQQKNDAIKTDYCHKNNINLLRLPYTLTDENIRDNIIQTMNP